MIQVKVCLLGAFAVGKTSLVVRFVEGRFDDRYLSTIGVKVSRKVVERSHGAFTLLIWDLAGEEKFGKYQSSYLSGAAGALIVCDLTRRETLEQLSHFANALRDLNPKTALVFIGNKSDLVAERSITTDDLDTISAAYRSPILLTSAITGDQVDAAFTALIDQIETNINASRTP